MSYTEGMKYKLLPVSDEAKLAAMALDLGIAEQQAWRLAAGMAEKATIAPGGTKWRRFELPRDHRVYALMGFEGENVLGGGETVEEARKALLAELLRRAKRG